MTFEKGCLVVAAKCQALTRLWDNERMQWDGGEGGPPMMNPVAEKGDLMVVLGTHRVNREYLRVLHADHGVWWIYSAGIKEVIDVQV